MAPRIIRITTAEPKTIVQRSPKEAEVANIDRSNLNFGREERHLTKVFKALSDGTRQEILRLLESHQRTVGEIVGNFNLSQPTISRHLSVLKEADLVVDQRQGQNVIYRLNEPALSASMQEFFGQFRSCQQALR
jgi:ArsR family transcriptional regulator, arsenate/arsenite/antimonite-responsive transcriptional repressor